MNARAIPRNESGLVAWAIALAAGETMSNGALGRGIDEATGGKAFGEGRLSHESRPCYALGYALGRFALLGRFRHCETMGEGKRRLFWQFQTSSEGRSWAASYPMQANLLKGAAIATS